MVRVVSLFSGCGGLDLGFKTAGYDVIWANDLLYDACKTYETNIGSHILCKDISKINISDVPRADLVLGGPPCQAFSLLGKRNPSDARAGLVWKYLEVIETIKPKRFLFENVAGLKSAKNPDGTSVVENLMKAFENIGYRIDLFTLNSADYGVPQRRKRVFILGDSKFENIGVPPATHNKDGSSGLKKWVSCSEALSDMPNPVQSGEKTKYLVPPKNDYQALMRSGCETVTHHWIPYSSKKDMEIIMCVPPGGNYQNVPDSIATQRILNFKKTGGRTTTYGRLAPDLPAYTINTHFNRPNVGCNIHYSSNRLITIREALRLQSFPDSFTLLSGNKRNFYLQVGNAVPPLLGKSWADHLNCA